MTRPRDRNLFKLEKESKEQEKESKIRKRDKENTSYNPKRPLYKKYKINTENSVNVLALRADTHNDFTHSSEEKIPLKTSMLIDGRYLPNQVTANEVNQQLLPKLSIIQSHRPSQSIIAMSKNGSPNKIETPNKAQLPRVARFGPFSIFSNDPKLVPIDDVDIQKNLLNPDDFFKSKQYQNIKKILITTKFRNVTLTAESWMKIRKKHANNDKMRKGSQNKIMVESDVSAKEGSASKYTAATKLFSATLDWEWCHLIAYMMLGEESQNDPNLVSATNHVNTEMMFAEAELSYLMKYYPEGVMIEASANLIPHTHIAITIDYTIKTKDFQLTLQFNAQTPNKPHLCYQKYLHQFIVALREAILNKCKTTQSTSKTLFPLFDKTSTQTTPISSSANTLTL